jgi:hypothetical protein
MFIQGGKLSEEFYLCQGIIYKYANHLALK